MKHPFELILILYNPKSTGDSEVNAKQLADDLKERLPDAVTIQTRATKHAGHAEEIGADYAKKDTRVLLVSSSGDGGYHELINGVLQHTSRNVATAVLPSGNANDHHHATAQRELVSRIVGGKTTKIDVIKIATKIDSAQWERYAHSYAGVGLTAYIGDKLNQTKLTPLKEKLLALKYILRFRQVAVTTSLDAASHHYSSIVIGNIGRMSKFIKLGTNTSVDDGLFEVYETRTRSFVGTMGALLFGSAFGLRERKKAKSYSLTSAKALQLQCDGEVVMVDAGAAIDFVAAHERLRTLR